MRSDFRTFYVAAKVNSDRNNAYNLDTLQVKAQGFGINKEVYPYLYSPVLMNLMYPFTTLNPLLAEFVWISLSLAALSVIFTLGTYFTSLLLPYKKALLIAIAWSIVFVFLAPTRNNIELGQVNIFILLFVMLSVLSYIKNKPRLAGFLISLPVFLKLVPILILPLLIVKKQKNVLLGFFIGALLMTFFSILLSGVNPWIEYIRSGFHYSTNNEILGLFQTDSFVNVSLLGFFSRIFNNSLIIRGCLAISLLALLTILLMASKKVKNISELYGYIVPILIANIIILPVAYIHHLIYLYPFLIFLLVENTLNPNKLTIYSFTTLLVLTILGLFDYPTFFFENSLHDADILKPAYSLNLLFLISIFSFCIYRTKKRERV
ncbi:MAG: glycosyltransferase family 87 protein [Candidatus Dojkabacteria bacterium]|nr:glycosyltransferase family 87 protein [Candidatus Dojkabacteria bacterium]